MFNHREPDLSGPDFLDSVADAEEALGNQRNAAEYRKRARQWQQDIDAASAAPIPTPVRALRRAIAMRPAGRA